MAKKKQNDKEIVKAPEETETKETSSDKSETKEELLKIIKSVPDLENATVEEFTSALEDLKEEDFKKLFDSLKEEDKAEIIKELCDLVKKTEAAAKKETAAYTAEMIKKDKEARKEFKKMYKNLPVKSKSVSLRTRLFHGWKKLAKILHLNFITKQKVTIYGVYKGPLSLVDVDADSPVYYAATREEALFAVNKLLYYSNIVHYNLWCMYRNLEAGFLKPSWCDYYKTVIMNRTVDETNPDEDDFDYIYSVMATTYQADDIATVLRAMSLIQPLFIPTETTTEHTSYLYNRGFDEYSGSFLVPENMKTIYDQDKEVHEKVDQILNYLNEEQSSFQQAAQDAGFQASDDCADLLKTLLKDDDKNADKSSDSEDDDLDSKDIS